MAHFLQPIETVDTAYNYDDHTGSDSGVYSKADLSRIESKRLGTIRLLELIGTGGMAEIWRGATTDGTCVAVKLLAAEFVEDEGAKRRFARESAITLDLRAIRGAARGLDQGIHSDGRQFLILECVEGPTLEEFVATSAPLAQGPILELMRGLCHTLGELHERQIFHRDLKPANIMLTQDDRVNEPRLVDFGIAAAPDFASLTQDRQLLGTLQYMTPEQIYGSPIEPVDIDLWGLSAVAYEALTRRPAFDAPSLGELCGAIRNGVFTLPSELRDDTSKRLDDFFARCFSVNRSERFHSVGSWLEALEVALCEACRRGRFPRLPEALNADVANDTETPSRVRRSRVKRWLGVAAAAVAFFVIGGVNIGHIAAQWSQAWP